MIRYIIAGADVVEEHPGGKWVLEKEARAEIERLTKTRDNLSRLEQSHREQANEQFHRAEKAEAALSESQALLAEAFEVAATMLETLGHVCESGKTLAYEVRCLTPADAKAALEAYGREKVRDGMKRIIDRLRHEGQINPSLTYADAIEWAEYVLSSDGAAND